MTRKTLRPLSFGRVKTISKRFLQSKTNNTGVVSLHINFHELFNAKAILVEKQQWYYSAHCWTDKGFHTFHKDISSKVNVMVQLEFDLAYLEATVQHF